MASKKSVTVIRGHVFNVYFSDNKTPICKVVAKDCEEAIHKAKLAFAGTRVKSVFEDSEYILKDKRELGTVVV